MTETPANRYLSSKLWPGRAAFLVLTVLYIAIFHFAYVVDLSPVYSYAGLTYSQPSLITHVFTWVFALIPAFCLPLRLRKPSDFVLWIIYICVYIPSLFVSLFIRLQSEIEVLGVSATLLVGMILMCLLTSGKTRSLPYETQRVGPFWIVLWGSFFISAAWIIAAFGSSLRLVALSDVYSSGVRFESRAIFDSSLVGFGVMMMVGAINPLLIAIGLQKKNKVITLAGIAGQVLCYSTGGFKSIAYSLALMAFLHLVIRRHMWRAAHVMMALSIGILGGCHLLATATDPYSPESLTAEATMSRAYVMPGQLLARYSSYFARHPHLHLSNTKPFSWYMSNPLYDDVIFVINDYYGGKSGVTDNADFWAEDGIANFGLPGIVIVSILAGLVLRLVDSIAGVHDPCFSTMAFSFAAFNLANAPLSTTLLSGGLLLSMFLMALAPISLAVREEPNRMPRKGRFTALLWQISKILPSGRLTQIQSAGTES